MYVYLPFSTAFAHSRAAVVDEQTSEAHDQEDDHGHDGPHQRGVALLQNLNIGQ
jgi:hypothetical protein